MRPFRTVCHTSFHPNDWQTTWSHSSVSMAGLPPTSIAKIYSEAVRLWFLMTGSGQWGVCRSKRAGKSYKSSTFWRKMENSCKKMSFLLCSTCSQAANWPIGSCTLTSSISSVESSPYLPAQLRPQLPRTSLLSSSKCWQHSTPIQISPKNSEETYLKSCFDAWKQSARRCLLIRIACGEAYRKCGRKTSRTPWISWLIASLWRSSHSHKYNHSSSQIKHRSFSQNHPKKKTIITLNKKISLEHPPWKTCSAERSHSTLTSTSKEEKSRQQRAASCRPCVISKRSSKRNCLSKISSVSTKFSCGSLSAKSTKTC